MHKIIERFTLSLGLLLLSTNLIFAQAEKKNWTVLVYLNADNNLERFGYEDIREMEKVGSTENLHLVVQFDHLKKEGTERYYIEQSKSDYKSIQEIQSPLIESLEEVDMGDAEEFIKFVTWGVENYPSDHLMVVVWNHGSGWRKDEDVSFVKGISYDESSGNHISTNQFNAAMKSITEKIEKKVDIITMDACLMAMAEVIIGLQGTADYLVSSEEYVPGRGMPYDKWLLEFYRSEDKSPKTLLRILVEEFAFSYSGGSQGTSAFTMSAIDLNLVPRFEKKFDSWVDALIHRSKLSVDDKKKAAKKAPEFGEDGDYSMQSRDLPSYVRALLDVHMSKSEANESEEEVKSSAGFLSASLALLDVFDEMIVENKVSANFARASGLAIYLPTSENDVSEWNSTRYWDRAEKQKYLDLDWSLQTDWQQHLDELYPSAK